MLIGTVIFLSLIVILLAMPVTLTYQLHWQRDLSARVKLNWAFGLIRADVSPGSGSSDSDSAESGHTKTRRQGGSPKKKRNYLAAIRYSSFRRRCVRFISDVWYAIHKKNVQLLVRMGLGDPADTGRLWAAIGPLSGMLATIRDIRVVIEPDFIDSTFEVDSSGTVRVIPLQLIGLVLGLLVSPPVWRGIKLSRLIG